MNETVNALPASYEEDERAVFELIEAYQAELDAGHRPERQHFLDQLPHQRQRLTELMRVCDLVSTPPLASSTVITQGKTVASTLGHIGDYQLLREIARGGMGIIYEALQQSLGRKVALKLMRHASRENDRSWKRFSNEAHAAATLQHPHIVAVYACDFEAAPPYYVMQLIDGVSIARLIQHLRVQLNTSGQGLEFDKRQESDSKLAAIVELVPPLHSLAYFQWAARLMIQALQALQYAHDCGMVHRDIKPGNLLLDSSGKLWVTDFGLAHLPGSDVTVTGETLGTPRYMSPEQLNYPKTPVDHRSDIYSLGVTLYELITLQPAFGQDTRQHLAQAILQADPVSPKKLEPAMPADLQIITCKALAKDAHDRFATAQQMCEELQRFLDDRPILSRPPSLSRLMRQWARRNPLIASSSIISLGLLLLAFIAILWRENQWNETTVANQAAAMQTQDKLQSRVTTNLRMALGILEEYFLSEEENRMLTESIPMPRKQEILQQGIRLYEQLAASNNDPLAGLMYVKAHRRLGTLYLDVGQPGKAEAELRQAVLLARQQIAGQSSEGTQLELVECLSALARALRMHKQPVEANVQYQQALEAVRQLHRLQPANKTYGLMHANILVNMSVTEPVDKQLALKTEALGLLVEQFTRDSNDTGLRINLAFTYHTVAEAYNLKRQFEKSIELSHKALTLLEVMTEEHRNWRWQILLARCHTTLAYALSQTRRESDAQLSYEKALAALNSIKHYANVMEIHSAIALNQEGLGRLHFARKDYDQAINSYREAEMVYLNLARKQTDYKYWNRGAATMQALLASCYRKLDKERETIDMLERAITNDPDQVIYHSRLAWHLVVARDPQLRNGPRALECALRSLTRNESNPNFHMPLAAIYMECDEWGKAVQAAEKTIQLRQKDTPTDHVLLARALHGLGERTKAKASMTKAVELAKHYGAFADLDTQRLFDESCEKILGTPAPSLEKK